DGTPVSYLTLYKNLAEALQYLTFTRLDLSYSDQQLYSSSTSSLVAYSDVAWAGCPTTHRSTLGYCVFLDNNLLSWSSKRQYALSYSSADAEYRGVANAIAETSCAVYLSSNPVQHQHTKHIEIDIHFIRDHVSTSQVHVLHVPSRYLYADKFTEGLPTALLDKFWTSLSDLRSPALTVRGCYCKNPYY
ncbi:ribonuclease H-like domain-containing protein, partial [Tanacetum coccineum]